jgi:hypothetical protein
MKTIEMIKNLVRPVLIGGLGGFLSLGISTSAWGICEQNTPGASTVLLSSANENSCARIQGQFGCTVTLNGTKSGNCPVEDVSGNVLFIAVAKYNALHGLKWGILDPTTDTPLTAKVNTVIVESEAVVDGNACDYVYSDEAISGSGLGWFDDNDPEGPYAAVQQVSFCTNGETDDTPTPPCDPNICAVISPENEEIFMIKLRPAADDWAPEECTCFEPEIWTNCNADTTSDNEGVNKCTGGPLKALPVHFEAGNDGTWICRTIGGERKCWRR